MGAKKNQLLLFSEPAPTFFGAGSDIYRSRSRAARRPGNRVETFVGVGSYFFRSRLLLFRSQAPICLGVGAAPPAGPEIGLRPSSESAPTFFGAGSYFFRSRLRFFSEPAPIPPDPCVRGRNTGFPPARFLRDDHIP